MEAGKVDRKKKKGKVILFLDSRNLHGSYPTLSCCYRLPDSTNS
ncbi:hypothetical protein EAI_01099 [Harpegnathos saltator]|uniref:Uncharacterized protein n=1 Tax=Harpegnathos saltator TaxID=610380 RepID=E2B4V7_HARSA|nr:hypothetical protein EAI_01099 [Harpegnathos saltator]